MPVRLRGYPQCTAGRHCVLGIEKQVEKDLLEFAGVAQNRRKIIFERSLQLYLGNTELVFQQLQSFFDHVIEIQSRKLRRTSARKIQQAIHDFRGPERLLRDLVQKRRHSLISPHLFGEHLGIRRNHGQGSVDLMRHAGCQ